MVSIVLGSDAAALLEDGSRLLLEDGSSLLLEGGGVGGVFALSGGDFAFVQGPAVAVGPGAFALSGSPATFEIDLAVAGGSFAFSGGDVTFVATARVTAFGSSDPLAATPVPLVAPDPALARTAPESAAILPVAPDPALARTSPESATRLPSWRL